MIVGEIISNNKEIIINENRRSIEIQVANTGDRPIQVGSHFHFFETNRLLDFDREKAFGMRLDIPSGTSVRFEPGEKKTVKLVEVGGAKKIYGFNDFVRGKAEPGNLKSATDAAREKGLHKMKGAIRCL